MCFLILKKKNWTTIQSAFREMHIELPSVIEIIDELAEERTSSPLGTMILCNIY